MNSADRLLEIIQAVDLLISQMRVDGHEGYAEMLKVNSEDLMWLYRDLIEYES